MLIFHYLNKLIENDPCQPAGAGVLVFWCLLSRDHFAIAQTLACESLFLVAVRDLSLFLSLKMSSYSGPRVQTIFEHPKM